MWKISIHLFLELILINFGGGSSLNIKENVQTAIAGMKKIDFHSINELELLESILSNIREDSRTLTFYYSREFVNEGGLDVIELWLNQFLFLSAAKNTNDFTKAYCGQTLALCFFGSQIEPFRDKMIEKGMFEVLLQLVFSTNDLFEDPEFTDDSFLVVLTLVAQLATYEQLKIRLIVYKVFGPDFRLVQNRFDKEENPICTLLLTSILLGKYDSVSSDSDVESFEVDPVTLWHIRDNILSSVSTDELSYKAQVKTLFIMNDVMIKHYHIVKYFNVLLISKCNRLNLCDQQTLDHYLAIIDQFSASSSLKDDFVVMALRGIFILIHSCPKFSEYIKNRLGESK